MGRGINIGNVLSAPKEGNWAPVLTETYLEDVKNAGFKTVRIPIDFFGSRTSGNTSIYSKLQNTSLDYTGNPADYIVNSSYLDRIEEVIQWALNQQLIVILDFHGNDLKSEFLYSFSDKEKWQDYYSHPTSGRRKADNEKFRAIWTQIANRFKEYPDNLIFEVINEPYFWISDLEMDVLNKDIIAIVRNSGSKNTTRNIIITGGSKNAFEAPLQIGSEVLNSDNHLIATFHYYHPRAFTASSEQGNNDFDWGTNDDKAQIDADFGLVKNWSVSNNIPVLLGEFGADNELGYNYFNKKFSSFGGPDKISRKEFHRYIAQKAIDLGFSFTAWDAGDRAGKSIYLVTDRTWVEDVKNALLGINNTNCLHTTLIKNADIECGATSSWNLSLQGSTLASIGEASLIDTKSNTSLKVEVTNEGSNFNQIIIKNETITSTEFSGKTYNFSTYAKGSADNQQFRIRINTISDGITTYNASSIFNLKSTSYEKFDFEFTIPENTTSIEFQLLCGKTKGTYFFDDFSESEKTLSASEFTENTNYLKIYPNPIKDFIHISTNKQLKKLTLYDINGKNFTVNHVENTVNLSNFSQGLYFLKTEFSDNTSKTSKILITNNQ